ncbi:Virulence protein RhuM family protein [Flavobacterium omnivorum]|uniref:Virulence protein RhuM family protein n=1 Tax=Flavobacterium omnivorum TaxID=178355 RepID=A0A1G8H2Y2_9FLAO|nr:Virulence protein RhuM family protein [Flavobacterium omnivorum]
MIISIRYRVKSPIGIGFRKWTNRQLKIYLIKGYAVNTRIIKYQKGKIVDYHITLCVCYYIMQISEMIKNKREWTENNY